MYKVKLAQGSVFKSYNIQEIADIAISNRTMTLEFYQDYKMLSYREFIDLYFKETKSEIGQINLTKALKPSRSLTDIYSNKTDHKCSCCKRVSTGFYETIKEGFKIYFCEKHKEQMIHALYVFCSYGQEEYQKFIKKIL
jgi:hypothetical protein